MYLGGQAVSRRGMLRRVLEDGGPGCCHFAITSHCNAGCAFCNFSQLNEQAAERVHVPVDAALASLDVLAANGIGYIVFTGGEPTTHPDLPCLLAHAKNLGMSTTLSTNGWLLTSDRIGEYARAGLARACISVDAPGAEEHEANRKLPGLCQRIAEANMILRRKKILTAASVTISRLIADMSGLPDFLKSLNFDSVTFSYPLTWLPSTYRAFRDCSLTGLASVELLKAYRDADDLRKRFRVLNPTAALNEMQRFVRGERQRFPCLGGFKYFYLDWHLNVYRCFAWPEPMCSIWEFSANRLIRDGCVACMSDCFRDASVMHHVGVALYDAVRSLSRGRVDTAVRQSANRAVCGSISALAQQRNWVRALNRHA